jgi:two-component system, LytTR family, response regulator
MTELPRVLIVDDERLARLGVRQLLEEHEVEVVGECDGGEAAIAAIRQLAPDLVFLDVQMPEVDGFDVLERVGPEQMPAVVFVTAYDDYAVRAFEVHALDYLLKPFSAERFRSALGHARDFVAKRRANGLPAREAGRRNRLMIKSSGRIHFLRMADIDWCEAAGNYVRVHVGPQCYLVRDTMSHLESELDPQQFIRIHRSTIVNVDRVQEMQSSFNGEYVVLLRGGTRLTLSRGYRDAIHARLGKPL